MLLQLFARMCKKNKTFLCGVFGNLHIDRYFVDAAYGRDSLCEAKYARTGKISQHHQERDFFCRPFIPHPYRALNKYEKALEFWIEGSIDFG